MGMGRKRTIEPIKVAGPDWPDIEATPGVCGDDLCIRGTRIPGWAFGLDTREVGGLGILARNVAMLLACWPGRRSSKLGGLMLLGLAGNAAVVLGWLGASAVERQLHGSPADHTPVVLLVRAQLALGCLALAPAGCLRPRRAGGSHRAEGWPSVVT